MELGVLGLDGITASGNGFGSASLDVESLKQKWVTRSEGFKQEGSGFPGDLCRASKVAKTDSDFSLDSTVSSDAHMLRFSSNSKLETSTLPYLHHMEAAQYKNSEYYSSGGLDASTGVYLLSGVRGPFTPSQWLELEQQALIYKYITANEPIPFHLLIPIRKAFESAGFYGLNYPTLKPTAWGWGPFHLGYSNNTDPEPGRCRRTDGKKWRCSRDAVVNQKYCDKHINRGRHRSRKHVEGQSNGHSVSGATTKPVAASSAAPSVLQGGGSSNSFGINQNEHFHGTSSNCNTNASLNRMVVNRGNNGRELQDATRLSFLSQGHQGVNLNCSGSSFSISSEQHMDVASLKTFGSYANTHNSLCTYMSNNSSDRLSNLYPMGPADFMSSTSSPINEKAAVSSSLRLSQDYEMGLGFGSPRQPSWKPISWEASMGGPLAEALQSNCISNSTDESRKSSAMSAISPSGVLQRGGIVSMSNSSAGSSPRADNSKTIESGGSLCTDLLGSAAMARSSFFLPAFV